MEKDQGPPPGVAAPPYQGPPPGLAAPPYPGPPIGIQPQPQPNMQPAPVGYQYNSTVQYSSTAVQQPQIVQPVSQVVVMQQLPRDVPGQMVCPHCQNTVVTRIEHKNGLLTWTICGTLAIIGCWPCFVIPFFVEACKDVEHSCPSCNNVLHIYKRR